MNPPPMTNQPPAAFYNRDDEHLKLLSIFHYVIAGFDFLGVLFIILHFTIMSSVFTNDAFVQSTTNAQEAEVIKSMFGIFGWFYLLFAIIFIAKVIINFLAARYLKLKKHRTFTMVVAGINCINIPLGTALGVFTFIVLARPSVTMAYHEKQNV